MSAWQEKSAWQLMPAWKDCTGVALEHLTSGSVWNAVGVVVRLEEAAGRSMTINTHADGRVLVVAETGVRGRPWCSGTDAGGDVLRAALVAVLGAEDVRADEERRKAKEASDARS